METPQALSLGLLVFFFGSACTLIPATIQLEYVPRTGVQPVARAGSVTTLVSVSDARSRTDRVSSKPNRWGMEIAAIKSQNDPPSVVQQAIEAELTSRGFHIGQGGVAVKAEVDKYYCDFKTGVWSGEADAQVTLSVQVLKSDGSIVFAKVVEGEGKEPDIQVATGENAKLALDRALQDAMDKLLGDSTFVDALMKASTV